MSRLTLAFAIVDAVLVLVIAALVVVGEAFS